MYLSSRIVRHNTAFALARPAAVFLAGFLLSACDPPSRDRRPSFRGVTIDAQVYFQDAAIPNMTLPEAIGGDGPRRYTLDPPLPPGLTFNAATRVLSGTPTETLEPTRFSYTVRDADDDMDIRTFVMSVSTISLEADAQELAEWNDPGVPVTVSVSQPPPLAVAGDAGRERDCHAGRRLRA